MNNPNFFKICENFSYFILIYRKIDFLLIFPHYFDRLNENGYGVKMFDMVSIGYKEDSKSSIKMYFTQFAYAILFDLEKVVFPIKINDTSILKLYER